MERPFIIRAARFQVAQLIICNDLARDHGYAATQTYQALGRRSPAEAVDWVGERVLHPDALSWIALVNAGAVWATFEVQVLDPQWVALFSDDIREAARDRLRRVAAEHPEIADQVPSFLRAPAAALTVVPRTPADG